MSRTIRFLLALALVSILGTTASLRADDDPIVIDDGVIAVVDSDGDDDRGWLGIQIQDLSPELSEALEVDEEGVLVSDVNEDSPAETSGVEARDVILSINGQRVRDVDMLTEIMRGTQVGETVELEVIREGKRKTLKVELGERPSRWTDIRIFKRDDLGRRPEVLERRQISIGPRLGVQVNELNEDLASYFGVSEGEGVLTLRVYDDSAAEKAGIKAGDILLQVDGKKISSAASLREALTEAGEGEVSIKVRRKGKEMEITAELEGRQLWMPKSPPEWERPRPWDDSRRWRRYQERFESDRTDRDLREHTRELRRNLRSLGRDLRLKLNDELRELRKELDQLKDEMDDIKEGLRDRD